jgi:hypothetical protein
MSLRAVLPSAAVMNPAMLPALKRNAGVPDKCSLSRPVPIPTLRHPVAKRLLQLTAARLSIEPLAPGSHLPGLCNCASPTIGTLLALRLRPNRVRSRSVYSHRGWPMSFKCLDKSSFSRNSVRAIRFSCVVFLCGFLVWFSCVVFLCGFLVWFSCVVFLCGFLVWFSCVVYRAVTGRSLSENVG